LQSSKKTLLVQVLPPTKHIMMSRSRDKKSDLSPTKPDNKSRQVRSRPLQIRSPVKNQSPTHNTKRQKSSQQSGSPRSVLYDNGFDTDDSNSKSTIVTEIKEKYHQSNKNLSGGGNIEPETKLTKTDIDNHSTIPDTIGSIMDNTDDSIHQHVPMSVSSTYEFPMKGFIEEDNNFPSIFKPIIINAVRTIIFRKIKFLNNEKLSMDSSIFHDLLNITHLNKSQDNPGKYYDAVRQIVMRQMNSKRNYCTDQILAKARGMIF
jgi:hypothetical protein